MLKTLIADIEDHVKLMAANFAAAHPEFETLLGKIGAAKALIEPSTVPAEAAPQVPAPEHTHELSLIAAAQWAQANVQRFKFDAEAFGRNVSAVAKSVWNNALGSASAPVADVGGPAVVSEISGEPGLLITRPMLLEALTSWEQDARDGAWPIPDASTPVSEVAAGGVDYLWPALEALQAQPSDNQVDPATDLSGGEVRPIETGAAAQMLEPIPTAAPVAPPAPDAEPQQAAAGADTAGPSAASQQA